MMRVLWIIIFFLFGSVLGSFYNVVGLRVPKKESIVYPNSHCMRCGHDLKWYEMIPIISYIFLKGRCRNCKEKISIMYPFIEFFTGILFAVSFYSYGFSYDLIIALILSSLLNLVIVSDVNYMIIPDSFLIISIIMIIIIKLVQVGIYNTLTSVGYGVICFLILLLIMFLGNKIFKKESLGGADIKLFFIIGLIFNPLMSMLVLIVACFAAFPVSIILYFKNKENIIPFGPFIILATLFVYFTKINFMEIINYIRTL